MGSTGLYEVTYTKVSKDGQRGHCSTRLTLDSPSESQAIDKLYSQCTVSRDHRIIIEKIVKV